jgi:IMP dehydrogenase
MREGLTFDDVCLVPRYNNVRSRTEPDLSTWLTKNTQIKVPLVPANMDTVVGAGLARIIVQRGGIPLFHRFTTLEHKMRWVEEFPECFISAGVNKQDLAEIETIAGTRSLKGVVLDVAHGHSMLMVDAIKRLKDSYPSLEVIAGNICTARAYHDLAIAGADAVKIGIGSGAACTTRLVTGFGVPQFTAIRDCAEEASHFRVPLMADGGIRTSADVVKALAAGAATVMMGKVFALTEESAAEKRPATPTGQVYGCGPFEAKYRGQASADFQKEYYGGLKRKTVAEGVDFWAPVAGSAEAVIDEFLGGIRSGMTYAGARSIKELQRKAEFVKVTSTYHKESNPRMD